MTRRLATAGYHAVAPALYHRAGVNDIVGMDLNDARPIVMGTSDDDVLIDVDAVAHPSAASEL